jgi:cystathionine beta-lyase/cystathionine gamma-synthase
MESNATAMAYALRECPGVKVYYPLFDAKYPLGGQMKGPGHIVVIEFDKGLGAAHEFMQYLNIPVRAVSLGGVFSLASISSESTHACIPAEEQQKIGVHPATVRISAGTEDELDLIPDVVQAAKKAA